MRVKWHCPKCKKEEFVNLEHYDKMKGKVFMHICKCGSPMVLVEVTEEEGKQLLLPGCTQ